MSDLIERQAAIDAVNELTRWYYETFHEKRPTANAVIDKLMDLPSAEPEIIYCQECIKADLCAWRREGAKYCSYAERRTDE